MSPDLPSAVAPGTGIVPDGRARAFALALARQSAATAWPGRMTSAGRLLLLVVLAIGAAPASAAGANPNGPVGFRSMAVQVQTPGQDTIFAPAPQPGGDTIDVQTPPVGPDGPTPADSAGAVPLDSLAGSIQAEPEFRVRNLPAFPPGPEAGWAAGIWEWDRERLRATRALTLLELLEEVPGVVLLRGGDYGQPSSVSAFGVSAGRMRVFWDGAELPPLDGGVVDLSRVRIAGLERVRVERAPGGLRIELTPLSFSDPRPYSFLEVGTGDLETNLFRGIFAHPDVLGGSIVVSLDRLDTSGPQRREPGVTFGGHVRHTLFLGERLGVAWEFARSTSRRPEELWVPGGVQRSDWGVRARYEIAPGIVSGLGFQRSSLAEDVGEEDEETEGILPDAPRSQLVGRLSVEREEWWAEGEYREQWGEGWPASVQALRAGGPLARVGGASVSAEREVWDEESPISLQGRVWSRPFLGLSAFAEVETGRRGVPYRALPDPDPEGEDPAPEPEPTSFTERTGIRVGVEYHRGDLFVGGAFLSLEADSLHPTGLPPDRGGVVAFGGERTGFEASGSVPLDRILSGLSLRGSAQFWDESETWRFLPRKTYEGRASFHDVFLESGNLEIWSDVGVSGRDPMAVPLLADGGNGLATVPFHQSWFTRLQIRVVSVRAFVRWDNFTLRAGNQDFPGRELPQTRVMYGIRWTMWN